MRLLALLGPRPFPEPRFRHVTHGPELGLRNQRPLQRVLGASHLEHPQPRLGLPPRRVGSSALPRASDSECSAALLRVPGELRLVPGGCGVGL